MADINQTAEWVTARLTELGNATNEGLNTLVTSGNVGNYTAGNVSGTVAIENGGTASTNATDARLRLGITPQNIGAVPASGGTFTGDITFDGDVAISGDLTVGGENVMDTIGTVAANLAPEYSAASTYSVGDYVLYNSVLYECTTAITAAEEWTAGHWTQVKVGDEITDLKEDLSSLSSNLYPYGIPPYMMSLFKHSDNIFSDFCNAITNSYYGVRGGLTVLGNELLIKTANYNGWLIRIKPNTTYTLGPCDFALIFFNSEFKSDKVIPTANVSDSSPNTVTSGDNSYWMALAQKTGRDMSEWMMVEGDTYPSEYISGYPQWISVPKVPDGEMVHTTIAYGYTPISVVYENGTATITLPNGLRAVIPSGAGTALTSAQTLTVSNSAYISYDATTNEWFIGIKRSGHETYVIGFVAPSAKFAFFNSAFTESTGGTGSTKTIAFMGDSITAGVATAKCYHQYIHDKYGLTCLNYGYGGAGYYQSYQGYSAGKMGTGAAGMGVPISQENYFIPNNVVTRLAELDASALDGIVIFAGTNDWGNNVSVENFRTGITEAFEYCLTNYPAIPVLVMLPIHRMNDATPNSAGKTLREYADIIVEECKRYGIAYVDTMTMTGLSPDIEANRALYFKNNLGSGLHPSKEGHRRIASVIADMLNAVISYTDFA